MTQKPTNKKKSGLSREQKRMRTSQILFAAFAVIIIISMVVTLFVK